jgi:hypothetical protein
MMASLFLQWAAVSMNLLHVSTFHIFKKTLHGESSFWSARTIGAGILREMERFLHLFKGGTISSLTITLEASHIVAPVEVTGREEVRCFSPVAVGESQTSSLW